MALSLNDIRKEKKSKEVRSDKEEVLRPWQSFDDGALGVRTTSAQEAVRRAKEIVNNNNLLAEKLRNQAKKREVINREFHQSGEDVFDPYETSLDNYKINTKSGLFGFIKEMLSQP